MKPNYQYRRKKGRGQYDLDKLQGATLLDRFMTLQRNFGRRVPDDDVVAFIQIENATIMGRDGLETDRVWEQVRDESVALYDYLSAYYLPLNQTLQKKISDNWPYQPLIFRLATLYKDSPFHDGIRWNTMQICNFMLIECMQHLMRHTFIFWFHGAEDSKTVNVPRELPPKEEKRVLASLQKDVCRIAREGDELFFITHIDRRRFSARGYTFHDGRHREWTREELEERMKD